MQIHRIHTAEQLSGPISGVRQNGGSAGSGTAKSMGSKAEAGGAAEARELEQLNRLLGDVSEVRPDVVAEAKVRMQRGDYLTRAAAERTAAAILSKDA